MAKYFRGEGAARSGRAIYAYFRNLPDPQFEIGAEFVTPELESIRRSATGTVDNVIQWMHTAKGEKLFLPSGEKHTGYWLDEIYLCYLRCLRPPTQRVLPQQEFTARLKVMLESIGKQGKPSQINKMNEQGKKQNKDGYKLSLEDIECIIQANEDPHFKFNA